MIWFSLFMLGLMYHSLFTNYALVSGHSFFLLAEMAVSDPGQLEVVGTLVFFWLSFFRKKSELDGESQVTDICKDDGDYRPTLLGGEHLLASVRHRDENKSDRSTVHVVFTICWFYVDFACNLLGNFLCVRLGCVHQYRRPEQLRWYQSTA